MKRTRKKHPPVRVKPIPDVGTSRNTIELNPFGEWLQTISPRRLHMLLQDALWKNQIQETELYRMFLLEHYKSINMVPR